MADWIDDVARALGEEPLTPAETARLLEVARDVAHRVERKMTPLTTFLAGCVVGRELAAGASRTDTLPRTVDRLRAELPDESAPG
ncbi:molybdopterin-guanine dinucleotide biosynthesis protein MobA [Mycobacterium spongiae]|uniref:Molybdopterin-guanine dinucleotide biosynthesis protein MobA n=2 Tax=Mycobacterium spongiae TaxID=886343 RepID=A0A975JXG9_9MYCO|nr:molybdopterin-guanine dinucleotide biosynthesis protein MobA [Mycobacterium spongiae]